MESQRTKPLLSAVFIDYDNIYLSLKRKSAAAARAFAESPVMWLREIEKGHLITASSDDDTNPERRIVLNRSYGNPVPRRGSKDNTPDRHSFPFVRHHFLRAGSEIVDCPPLTSQLKNSADIRMVMDIRDLLTHETHFDEFIVLSGDSDFTPVLHRLRAHARRTIVYANDHTAMPYTAIADGEIREADLISLLESHGSKDVGAPLGDARPPADRAAQQDAILAEIVDMIRSSSTPVPIEALADRAQRKLGKEETAGSNWAGFGNFRAFLMACLPLEFRLTSEQPFLVFEPGRHASPENGASAGADIISSPIATSTPAASADDTTSPLNLQESIGRIHDACQAPPLGPPEYRAIFEIIAEEINENALNGDQTLVNIHNRAAAARLNVQPTDVRFVFDVVSEADPWFAQGASASLFAGRFRNFVVARCRTQGMNLSSDELELIDAWFAGADSSSSQADAGMPTVAQPASAGDATGLPPLTEFTPQSLAQPNASATSADPYAGQRQDLPEAPPINPAMLGDLAEVDVGQLPRIVRSRMRT